MTEVPLRKDKTANDPYAEREILERTGTLPGTPPPDRSTHYAQAGDSEPGFESVVDAVRDVPFPITIHDLAEVAGDRYPRPSKRGPVPLRSVLDAIDDADRFETLDDFRAALTRHWETVRAIAPSKWPPS